MTRALCPPCAQAIIARALCQSVAFPKMTESVNDLFDDTPGTSNVLIVAIETFFTPPDEELSFGEILHIVTMCSDGRDKYIGFTTVDGEQVLGPHLDHYHRFQAGERLILMSRRTRKEVESNGRC